MAKGEIACFEQFPLLSLCFQNAVRAAEASESVYIRESVYICLLVGDGLDVGHQWRSKL